MVKHSLNNTETKLTGPRRFIIGVMAVWAALSMGMVVKNTLSTSGGNDLYTYWIAGHFIRQGDDPYLAFLEKRNPSLPVVYLDREVQRLDEIIQPGLVPAPGYTYPFLLFFTLFAFLSWETAKWCWLLTNLGFTFMVPILAVRLLPGESRLPDWLSLTTGLAFLGLSATRYALSSGQITFLVLDLMILSILLGSKKPWLAGLLLGLALSKYSVSAGFLLFFILVRPNLRLAATAIAVQAAGVLTLIFLSGGTFGQVLMGYSIMFKHHAPMDGIHLASLFPINNSGFDIGVAVLLTLVVFFPIWLHRHTLEIPQRRLCALCALVAWSLLVAYHRAYDAVGIILFLVLTASVLYQPQKWRLSPGILTAWRIVSLAAMFLLMLPAGSLARSFTPAGAGWLWVFSASRVPTLVNLLGLFGTLWLLLRTSKRNPSDQPTAGHVGPSQIHI